MSENTSQMNHMIYAQETADCLAPLLCIAGQHFTRHCRLSLRNGKGLWAAVSCTNSHLNDCCCQIIAVSVHVTLQEIAY